MLTESKVRIVNELKQKIGSDINVISISFNEKDTAKQATLFKDKNTKHISDSINPSNWVFLTGSAESIARLSKKPDSLSNISKVKEFLCLH